MENFIVAEAFGFLPENSPEENSRALNKALGIGGEIRVLRKGIYEISDPVIIKSNTKIIFDSDIIIKKAMSEKNSPAFINEGAYTGEYNENIEIEGLNLICEKKDFENADCDNMVYFANVKNFMVKNSSFENLLIHISSFENIIIENCNVENDGEGVYLGSGINFVVRSCNFRTSDTPLILNSYDSNSDNPCVGELENGIVDNCTDMETDEKSDSFCEILSGAWVDWYSGMTIRNGDTVVYQGKTYRATLENEKEFISQNPPGLSENGISWKVVNDNAIHNANCRNLSFKNIRLKKKYPAVFSIGYIEKEDSSSYYPTAFAPVLTDFLFENIIMEDNSATLINIKAPVDKVKIKSMDLGKSKIVLDSIKSATINYPLANFEFEDVKFQSFISDIIRQKSMRKANFIIK